MIWKTTSPDICWCHQFVSNWVSGVGCYQQGLLSSRCIAIQKSLDLCYKKCLFLFLTVFCYQNCSDLLFERNLLKVSLFWNVFLVSSLSSKIRTKTSRQVVKHNLFVRFLEETSAWKNNFEFVWPLVIKKCFEIWGWRPRICRTFEITTNICSNSERLEQLLATECFLNLFLVPWYFFILFF